MKHEMLLSPVPFHMIKSGDKTIELRLYDEKRKKIKIGDTICFYKTTEEKDILETEVLALYRFANFEELYEKLDLLACGYTLADIDTASPSDMERYYTKEQQEQYGVIGIELKRI